MKVSIVIICWNDRKDILRCLESIYRSTTALQFEVIVTDNGSTDGSIRAVRERFPEVRIVENGANLGFGGGNNAGFHVARGEYILILNPDTLVHDAAVERLLAYADAHSEGGAFGCRILNADGSYQRSAYPPKTLRSYLIGALYLSFLGRFWSFFEADIYVRWKGETERTIGYQTGCCLLVRRSLLEKLGGFDERLFHQCEDADLCQRVWRSGYTVRFFPDALVTHIGGQNRGRYPIPVILETHRSRYRYFYKHEGLKAAVKLRWITLLSVSLRLAGYGLFSRFYRTPSLASRIEMYRVLLRWHWRLDPSEFIRSGAEPDLGCAPLAAPPDMETFDHCSSAEGEQTDNPGALQFMPCSKTESPA